MVSMLVWIACTLKPIAARGFTHWRLSRYIDGFLGRVKCSPGPISKPIDFALQNPSRAYGFIGKEKHRLHAPIVPKCKPMKSQIKGWCHRSSLKRRDSTAYTLPLSDSPAVQINGATALLLQADMGWDKWLQSWSLCVVAAAEPPWNSLHSIWCPSPLPALHMFLLKYLVILDPNSSNSKRSALRSAPMKMERLVGGLTQVFLKRRDWTASVGCKADTGWDKWPCSLSLCGGCRASMKFSSFHMMSISTSCSSHVSFEISCHTWPKFIKFKT